MTTAAYTVEELMACAVSRELREGELGFIGLGTGGRAFIYAVGIPSVAIGRAIAFGTKLVIMDEPTAALGAVEAAKVLSLVRSLKDRGITVIVVSHNLQHVFSMADRIAVLRHGRMVGSVRPAETTGEAVVRMIVGADEAAVDLPAAPSA